MEGNHIQRTKEKWYSFSTIEATNKGNLFKRTK